eukprot:TRINITY_DN339_c0_g1_i4.p1 TRINITY_DN339_c0_g1~~TRINITY_DN339_c0_g1_i4.p1  ORF type:complete len:252 (-),score=53.38 TRINITY_DN339_c0_g1_i4:221-976(-)
MSSAIVENEITTIVPPPATVVEPYHYHAPSTSSNSKKRKRVSRACVCCQRAHMSCDEGRPCKRCVERGMAHLCRDGQRKQRGRKRRGPRGARGVGDVDVEGDDDLVRDEPDSKRVYFGSDDDGTTSPSDSDDDIDVVGDASSFDEDSSTGVHPRHPINADWNMDCPSSDRSTMESSSECGMDHMTLISDADMMLPLINSFDPVIAREALQSTFFDNMDYASVARESDRFFAVDAMMQHHPHFGYQLLDCTF